MKILNCTYEEIKSLKDYKLDPRISNVESRLKIIEINNIKYLLKFYKSEIKSPGMDTVKTNIETLIKYRKILTKERPSLILPIHLINIEDEFIAHTMEPIEGTNLQKILFSKKSTKHKINLLKQIGIIISSFGEIQNFPKKMYLGDINESNFILDKNGRIRICDIPSCHIEGNGITYSKYLMQNNYIFEKELREKYQRNIYDMIAPNSDTDILCYSFIILNTLAGQEIHMAKRENFNNYLDYLSSIGITYEFIDCIQNLFTRNSNYSPLPFLETITTEQFEKANALTFEKKTGITL